MGIVIEGDPPEDQDLEKEEELEKKEVPPKDTNLEPEPTPRIDAETLNLIREKDRAINELSSKFAALEARLNEQAKPAKKEFTFEDLTADTDKTISGIFKRELDESVSPTLQRLSKLADAIDARDSYADLKNRFKAHSKLGPALLEVETEVDQIMRGVGNPDEKSMLSAIVQAQGLKVLTGTKEKKPTSVIDKEIPPSANVGTSPPKKKENEWKAPRKMTETERAFARKAGIKTEEEFFKLVSEEEMEINLIKESK